MLLLILILSGDAEGAAGPVRWEESGFCSLWCDRPGAIHQVVEQPCCQRWSPSSPRLFDECEKYFGVPCVDLLVNNAGINTNWGWRKCMEVRQQGRKERVCKICEICGIWQTPECPGEHHGGDDRHRDRLGEDEEGEYNLYRTLKSCDHSPYLLNIARLQNAAQSTSHRFSRSQVVFTKDF